MVAIEDSLSDEESLRAYSYDASGLEERPALALVPRSEEQLRHILIHANQHHLAVVPRGAGTGIRGAVVRTGAVIIDMRGFDRIERLDKGAGTVDVGAGVSVERLNRALAAHNLCFPLVPQSPHATIGGLAAQNHVTEESERYGDYLKLVAQLECFDGVGRFSPLKGSEVRKVIGKEGTTGIITKLRARVFPVMNIRTADVVRVKSAEEAISAAHRLSVHDSLVALEYLDERCAELFGLKGAHVLAFYSDEIGTYKDPLKAQSLWQTRKQLVRTLWKKGFTFEEEATLNETQASKFIRQCDKDGAACFGHIGIGVLCAQLRNSKDAAHLRNDVVAMGALPAGKHGFGRTKAEYVPAELKKEVIMLKEDRDYNHLLNPGVILVEQMLVKKDGLDSFPVEARRAALETENPAFMTTKDLRLSNRHMWYLVRKAGEEKKGLGVPSPQLYKAMLGQDKVFDDAVIEARRSLVKQNVETEQNKAMIARMRVGKSAHG
jgi:FAD/FMN-containing dehydrogenase